MKKLSLMVFWLFLWLSSVFAYDDVSFEVLVTSEEGAYINQWETQVFASEEWSKIQATKNSYDEAVFFTVTDPTQLQTPLQFVFESGEGKLAKGEYDNATRHPFNPDAFAGMDISGDGRWCNEVIGGFDVQYIQRSNDKPSAAFIVFEHYCEKNEDQWLYWYIAYNLDNSTVTSLYESFWDEVEEFAETQTESEEESAITEDAYVDILLVDFVENLMDHVQDGLAKYLPQYVQYCDINPEYEWYMDCDLPKSLSELDKRVWQAALLRKNIISKMGVTFDEDEVDLSFFTDKKSVQKELAVMRKELPIVITFGKTLDAISKKVQNMNNQRVKDLVLGMQYTNYIAQGALEESIALLEDLLEYLP